jgi:hypothetical protein
MSQVIHGSGIVNRLKKITRIKKPHRRQIPEAGLRPAADCRIRILESGTGPIALEHQPPTMESLKVETASEIYSREIASDPIHGLVLKIRLVLKIPVIQSKRRMSVFASGMPKEKG